MPHEHVAGGEPQVRPPAVDIKYVLHGTASIYPDKKVFERVSGQFLLLNLVLKAGTRSKSEMDARRSGLGACMTGKY